jgi:hypothetical protein
MGTRAGLDYPEGDPGGLSAAASRLTALAAVVAGQVGRVARAGRVGGWHGRSARVFEAATVMLAMPLASGADALRRAARVVDDLADRVTHAQARIRQWAEQIEQAEQQAEAAQVALNAVLFPSSPLADHAWDLARQRDAQERFDRASAQVADLLARYQPKARQLCEEIERADRWASEAVLAAADAAPAGGAGVPGAPRVPAEVRAYAPVWLFAPDESYLPADPRRFLDVTTPKSAEDFERFLRGQGAGAPIFYRVRTFGDEKVIEYWFYRRWNDFRDLGIPGASRHPDDSEGVAVRIRDGRPVQIGYTQHEHGCSLPFGEAPKRSGHPVSYPGDGSGSNSPYRGAADNQVKVVGFDINPFEDLHGPAPGERTPRDHIVHGEDNLRPYRGGRGWHIIDEPGNRVPDSEPNRRKFLPTSPLWSDECEPLRPRD